MKRIIAVILIAMLIFSGCGGKETVTTDLQTEITEPIMVTTNAVTTKEVSDTAIPPEQSEPFDINDAHTVEDYFGGDVVYNADFDGDGSDETCTVKIVGHGTQCYVEEIVIEKQNGETIEVQHPKSACIEIFNFYKGPDAYELGFSHMDDFTFKFEELNTPPEHLTELVFGDIFDYSVIGDKLYFRGSLACGPSEVLADVVYEYTYSGGALKVCHAWLEDYIHESVTDVGIIVPTSSLLVEPAKCEAVSALPFPAENALLEGGPVGGLPRFYVFEEGLTYYVNELGSPVDITLRKYSKCVLDVPSGYTDAKIVRLSGGGGSGEATITVKAMRDGKETYIDYYFYCDDITTPEFVQELDYVPEM